MNFTFRKKKNIDPTHLAPDDHTLVDKKATARGTEKGFTFLGLLLKSVTVLIPVVIIIAIVPYGLTVSASVIQPFFKAANFTVNGESTAFNSLKREPSLRKDANGMTNILIIGIDTRTKGSRLLNTDTIILATYNHKTNEVAMVSFPRDLNVNYPNTPSIGKINATYAYGEIKKSGSGMEYLRQLIESISGQKIQYHVMVDLKGFTTIIDQLGGIDVTVDTAFTGDYPTEKFGWITVNFKKGNDHMNGNRALQFARIRHAYPGVEASDFARARRQQKVIQGVIDKATKVETLQNTKKIFEIMGTVANNIKINRVTPEDVEAGLLILKEKGKPTTFSMVLDPGAGGYARLIRRGAGYLYTLEPSAGRNNWTQVRAFIKDYAAAPGLVTLQKSVYVYNNGKENYSAVFTNIRNRFYYTDFYNGGSAKGLPKTGVYNIGGKSSASAAQYLATTYRIPLVEADSTTSVPKPKGAAIVMVLGK
ncbi:LCP family protein [bacterium]|nr:LCP family protein [bacterium]